MSDSPIRVFVGEDVRRRYRAIALSSPEGNMSARLSAFIHADIAHYEQLGRVIDISGGVNIESEFMGEEFGALADDSGIPRDRIAAICHRTTEPTAIELVRLARALDIAPGKLLEELHHDHVEV